MLTVPKKNKVNIFNGRILEMEGLPDLSVEQAFELTDAAAERSAAAGCIQLSKQSVATYLRSNVALMKKMIAEGYQDAKTLQNRIDAVNAWLKKPELLEADKNAEETGAYADVIEIDLAEITEPILACPNDPDDVKLLSDVAGTPIQDVFLGSCMTNIGHFRAAAEIWRGQKFNPNVRTWICPPTRMDQAQLKDEAYFAVYSALAARVEIAGCSLCMGNQARVPDGVNMFSTSTRNFDDRIGDGAKGLSGFRRARGGYDQPWANSRQRGVYGGLQGEDRAEEGCDLQVPAVRRNARVQVGRLRQRSIRVVAPRPQRSTYLAVRLALVLRCA